MTVPGSYRESPPAASGAALLTRLFTPHSLQSSVKIGLGDGVPVIVGSLILVIIYLWFRKCKQQDKMRGKRVVNLASGLHDQAGHPVVNCWSIGYARMNWAKPDDTQNEESLRHKHNRQMSSLQHSSPERPCEGLLEWLFPEFEDRCFGLGRPLQPDER